MGMDGVEIVMKVEEAFEIQIEDAEAGKILTPRQLIDLVMAKVSNVETEICLSHRAFNLARTFMVENMGFKRSEITPATQLSQLFPKERRKDFVSKFSVQFGNGFARVLTVPDWFQIVMIGFAVSGGVVALVPTALHFGFATSLFAFLVGAFISTLLAIVSCKPFANEFPSTLSTIGDLSNWIKRNKPDLAVKFQKAWTREQIAARVREIAIDVLGCEKTYREDARFVQDLGLS